MSIIKKSTFLKKFGKAVNEGYAAVFAGAGLSKSVGYVDWKTLLKPFAEELELDIELETNLARLAQFYRNEMSSRASINQEIIDQFSRERSLNENIKIITRLPIYTYWTTNYDQLLENGLKHNNRKPDTKITSEQLTMHKRDRDAIVYKMHGDVDFANEAVLTKEDFEIYNENRALFTTVLQGDLVAKTFLFIGFSFDDPNLDYILSRTRILTKGSIGESYWLEKEVPEPDLGKIDNKEKRELAQDEYKMNKIMQRLKINELQRYGIRTVLIKDYDEITSILEDLEKICLRKNVFISGSMEFHNSDWNEMKVNSFCSDLSKRLVQENYKVHSGFGLGVGSSIINGALEEIYDSQYKQMDEHLSLRPFPQNIVDKSARKRAWSKYRELMISEVGTSIFIFGNKKDSDGNNVFADGMWEEFQIAKQKGNMIIPIGSTGEMSGKIYEEVKANIDEYPYLKKYIEALNGTLDNSELIEIIIEIIKKN